MDVVIAGRMSDTGKQKELADRLTDVLLGELHLYQSSFIPTEQSLLADFTAAEANFVGYAAHEIVMSAVAPDSDGGFVSVSNRAFFQATNDVTPNTIGGAYVTTNAAAALRGFFEFPVPIPLTEALAYLAAVLFMRAPEPDTLNIDS